MCIALTFPTYVILRTNKLIPVNAKESIHSNQRCMLHMTHAKAAFCDDVRKIDAYPASMGGSGMITTGPDQADNVKSKYIERVVD